MCSCCLVSHIRREPEAETKDAEEAPEAAAAEKQKQHFKMGHDAAVQEG